MSEKKETASLEGGLTWGTTIGPYEAKRKQEAASKNAALYLSPSPMTNETPAGTATDFFGDAITPAQHGARLSTEFTYPPFSVLNARDGWWQERKREWLALGIRSELGRGDMPTADPAATAAQKRKADAMPGGGGPNSVMRGFGKIGKYQGGDK